MSQARKVYFQSRGLRCCGLYYQADVVPDDDIRNKHCIVMAHGISGVKEFRLDAYAEKFSQAGYNVFVFDYRYFGESEGLPRQLFNIPWQHEDYLAAIEYVTAAYKIARNKIILWGSSMSGGHVMAVGAKLPELAGVIAQVPHVSGFASVSLTPFVVALKLSCLAFMDLLGSVLGREPVYVNAAGKPGEVALMTGPGEEGKYWKLGPEGFPFDQRIAARALFSLVRYNPGQELKRLKAPALVQVGLHDITTPSGAVIKACRRASTVELKTYAVGHFEPYVEPAFSTFISDQISFLNRITRSR